MADAAVGLATASPTGSLLRVVVFSRDRPLQLDATLHSLELNLAARESADIHVLYRASTARYAAGYRVLGLQHPRAALHAETAFKRDLIGLLTGSTHIMFLVDDTMFVAEFSLAATVNLLARDPSLIGFSYRLGRNTAYCYTHDMPQQLPTFDQTGDRLATFDWSSAEFDFGYPLEVSSSLYRTADVLPIIERLEYRNPNTLEAGLAHQANGFRTTRPRLACYDQSVALSVPANMVQTDWENRVDGRPGLALAELEDLYDRGDRLDIESFRGHVAGACHEELEFRFRRDPAVPTVSVVIPCYNQGAYLAEAVDSVVAQTFDDWEIVIVDDGSTDDTQIVASRLIETHRGLAIRAIRQPNAGVSAARNAGIARTAGRYVLPLDADDTIRETMLERLVQALEEHSSAAVAYTDLETFGASASVLEAGVWSTDALCRVNQLAHCSMYRREVWEAVGGYNPNMVFGYEDWDFWLGAAETGYDAVHVPEPLFRYRVREGSRDAVARAYDLKLKAQIRLNHPRLFSRRQQLMRAFEAKRAGFWRRLPSATSSRSDPARQPIRHRQSREDRDVGPG